MGTEIVTNLAKPLKSLFFQQGNISIYNDNILNKNLFDDNFIDLIVTSPPYNLGIDYGSNNDSLSYQDYLIFTKEWMLNCYNWSKHTGRFILNIPLDKNKGGQKSIGADLTIIAKEAGWKYHSTIIWNESNISRRTAWGSWLSASAPYVIAPVELIVILYKGEWKKSFKGISDINRNEFIDWTNGLWSFNGESKKKIGHPAPFPRELPKRAIKLFSFQGDIVLDPFLGSGTTLLECIANKRIGIGVDIDTDYCNLAADRIVKEIDLSL